MSTNTVGVTEYFEQFEKSFVGRKKEINIIKYAILTKEHAMMFGLRGTAKSAVAEAILSNILVDGKPDVFDLQLHSQSTFEYLFGGMDTKAFREEGKVKCHLKDSMADKTFVFLDEALDAQDRILRGTLGALHERRLKLPHQKADIPLHTCVLATNHNRFNDQLDAFMDRIFFKIDVHELTNKKELMQLLDWEGLGEIKQMDFNRVERFMERAADIEIPPRVKKTFASLVLEWNKQCKSSSKVSNRRFMGLKKLLRASALLRDKKADKVSLEDLSVLQYAFPRVGDLAEETTFGEVMTLVVGSIKERENIEKMLDKIEDNLKKSTKVIDEAIKKGQDQKVYDLVQMVRSASDRLEAIVDRGTAFQETTERAERLRDMSKKLILDSMHNAGSF